ncbi:MAG TPA: hypothetical protein VLJ44_08220 [Gaiellaceae bacterium]|nr:hypothetical protein [Gaiellaceae bacterium]
MTPAEFRAAVDSYPFRAQGAPRHATGQPARSRKMANLPRLGVLELDYEGTVTGTAVVPER